MIIPNIVKKLLYVAALLVFVWATWGIGLLKFFVAIVSLGLAHFLHDTM